METKYGTLVRWFVDRSFGFIRDDESGQDVFTHVSGFTAKVASPKGTRVRFHLAPNNRRANEFMAVDVAPIVAATPMVQS
jgi:cold shock CspA family protein